MVNLMFENVNDYLQAICDCFTLHMYILCAMGVRLCMCMIYV